MRIYSWPMHAWADQDRLSEAFRKLNKIVKYFLQNKPVDLLLVYVFPSDESVIVHS